MKFLTYTILSLFLLLSFSVKAQNSFSVKGVVADTTSSAKLHNASVLVLRAKDSIMVKYTRVNQEGNFAINNLPGGKYLLLVTYPEYADYSEPFSLDAATPAKDFGRISMILKAKLLQDIVIKGKATAIKIKGDTTVFNASAFVVQPNAKVEDLIKQFPGVTVDKDGKVTANGQTVSKFLVGGEEFFGDDPTLVTKNIRADMVKEIQLYDKKSDQATFTGIDDGQKTRTMNVVLKEDKKSGYFGKVDAGAATQNFYSGQAMFNKFQNKEKFSFNATLSNNGRTGLSFQDEQKFGDGGNVTVMDNGGIMISGGGNDLYYDGRGFPISRSGGIHYDNKWNKDKYSINTNYKIGQLEVEGTANTLTQTSTNRAFNTTNSDETFRREAFRQKLDAAYLWTIDTSSTLKITVDGTLRRSTSRQDFKALGYTDRSFSGIDTLVTDQTRRITRETDQRVINATAFYTKKLKKKGRTFSMSLSNNNDNGTEKGYVYTNIIKYDLDTRAETTDRVDQYKPINTSTNTFNSNFTYTEPLSKYVSLVLNYGLNIGTSKSERLSYNASAPDKYDILDPQFSNSFDFNQLAHQGGAIVNYIKGKTTLNFGTKAADIQYKQKNLFESNKFLERHFINWMPQFTYQYRMGTQSSLYFNYNGSTQQPTVTQLQPLRDNTNLASIVEGNPDLKPSFSNRFNFSYNSYKALSGERFYVSGGYSFIENAFVSNQTVDINNYQVLKTVNMSDKTPYNYNVNATYGRNILGVTVQLSGGYNNNISYNFVNNVLNTTKNGGYSATLSISKYVANKYDLYLSGGPRYNLNSSSLQRQNSNSRGFGANAYGSYYLPAKFQITAESYYTYTGAAPGFEGIYRNIVTASISKMFFKDNSLKLAASANDLLNQNTGFNRTVNGANVVQNTNTTIRRYFMLTVTWDFTKMGGVTPKK